MEIIIVKTFSRSTHVYNCFIYSRYNRLKLYSKYNKLIEATIYTLLYNYSYFSSKKEILINCGVAAHSHKGLR